MKNIITTVLIIISTIAFAQQPLKIPPALSGTTFNLDLQIDTVAFFNGQTTNTLGINGNILGPTLIFEKDSIVNITVNNYIGDTTTMHWHGMHVSPEDDGGPHTKILPNGTWNPSFTIMDKAATFWYHPHLHQKTNNHVTRGLAGMIIVKDAEEAALTLPRAYGVDDFPLVLQTKAFDASNQIMVESHADSTFMINATINPYLDIPAQVVRLRLLNGSSNRTYLIGLSNNTNFDQIASDGGLLSAPVNLNRLRLAPGERAEILVNLNGMQGQTINLTNYCDELPIGLYGAKYPAMNQVSTLPDYNENPLNSINYNILQLNVVAQTASPITTIPTTLATLTPLLEANANKTRNITFGVGNIGPNFLAGPFLFNGGQFDMDTINEYVPLNNIEIWELQNNTQTHHPFHIHDIQFFILDRNGITPPANEQGLKDVVLVAPFEKVRFITQFLDFESDTIPYMYHCHMLPHEDMGMMGQFIVSSNIVNIKEETVATFATIYPNPTKNQFTIQLDATLDKAFSANIYAIDGKLIYSKKITDNKHSINTEKWVNGIYQVRVSNKNTFFTTKVVVQH